MSTRATIFIAMGLAATVLVAARLPANLEDVELTLTEVADSGSYRVFRYTVSNYTVSNPANSSWSIQRLVLDVSASSGAPMALPATGDFLNLTTWAVSTSPFAEVGPISPGDWRSVLNRSAELIWVAPSEGPVAIDSIPPDSALAGFGIRSSYLPGISTISAEPTWQACCSVPDPLTFENPERSEFAVTSDAVAPRYMPSEVDMDLLESQADAVCTDPLWITDSSFCTFLGDTLDAAQTRLAVNNYWGAKALLDTVYQHLLDRQGEPELHDNAFWMLFLNTDEVYQNIVPQHAIEAESTLCAHGPLSPAGTTAFFTITVSGDSLLVTSPHYIVAEVPGVDPEGSSCRKVWDFPLHGTEVVDVSIKMDSVTLGRELDEIYISFGAAGDTTIAAPQDSILISHDGATVSHIIYRLKTSGGS